MKKLLLAFLILTSCINAKKLDKIVIAGPFASVSHPFMHMIETNALKDIASKVEFRLWKNPDELRALVLSNDVDFTAIPTNVAANLYNKGVDIKLLNVSVWGILGMVSRDKNLKTLKDFKGKRIVLPFRADMPDIVFQELLKQQGINSKKDLELQYVNSPMDAMQMLILRRADHVLLAEPAISIALRKTKSFPISIVAPDLYRSVDLQEEWGKVFKIEAKIPQAGVAVLGKQKKEIIERFMQEYDKSLLWYKNNPKKAASLTVKTLKMLEEEGLADSIAHVNMKSVTTKDAKKDLEMFFTILEKSNPKVIGGKLPEAEFYK